MSDLIERQAAIDALVDENIIDHMDTVHDSELHRCKRAIERILTQLPSAQPERLTDDDFETIRIHLNAYKGNLCNQQRWKEAEEYQRIIDRFMAFATAQPEIIRCKDCKYFERDIKRSWGTYNGCGVWTDDGNEIEVNQYDFCSYAERRTDE